ncbi:MAG: hypothetical protein U9N80_10205 [Chloroflexota bacterium]|nr:hypothetical protein [Chloroflexota bacterium]
MKKVSESGINEKSRRIEAFEKMSDEIGADAYCRDAAIAVKTAKKLLSIKHEGID